MGSIQLRRGSRASHRRCVRSRRPLGMGRARRPTARDRGGRGPAVVDAPARGVGRPSFLPCFLFAPPCSAFAARPYSAQSSSSGRAAGCGVPGGTHGRGRTRGGSRDSVPLSRGRPARSRSRPTKRRLASPSSRPHASCRTTSKAGSSSQARSLA